MDTSGERSSARRARIRSVWFASRSSSSRWPSSAANASLSAAPRMMAWIGRVRAMIRKLYSTILASRSDAAREASDGVPPGVVIRGAVVRTGDVHDPFEQAALAAE